MFTLKIPLYWAILIASICTGAVSYFSFRQGQRTATPAESPAPKETTYNISRLSGFKYVKPLMYAESGMASTALMPVNHAIENYISRAKASGKISDASVYLRQFHNGTWTIVNPDHKFSPGSIMKIPVMITLMKMNESRPGLLDMRLTYNKHYQTEKTTHFEGKGIEFGKSYSVRELMHYMIAYSDNNATMMLDEILDANVFTHVFTDLGLAKPDLQASDFKMTAREASAFMIILYNAGYLSIQDSEYCLNMLGGAEFEKGEVKGLPGGCMIAHKYGEGGMTAEPDFSETAVIYCADHPYLLTVMTRGKDLKELPNIVAEITREVQVQMAGK